MAITPKKHNARIPIPILSHWITTAVGYRDIFPCRQISYATNRSFGSLESSDRMKAVGVGLWFSLAPTKNWRLPVLVPNSFSRKIAAPPVIGIVILTPNP
jgi:hypothetical protein